MNFFKNLFVSSNEASSKRFVGIVAFFAILIIAFVSLFSGLTLPEFMYMGILTVCLGSLGLTTIEKFNFRNGKENN